MVYAHSGINYIHRPKSTGAKYARKGAMYLAKRALGFEVGQMKKQVHYLLKQNNSEHKCFDYQMTPINPTTQGVSFEIFNPAQGNAYNQRIGDTCKILSMNMRFVAQASAAGSDVQFLRILCVKIKDNDASYPLSSLLQDVSSPNAVINSPKGYDKRFDTKFIFDKRIALVKGGREGVTFKVKIPRKYLGHVKFQPGSTTIDNNSYRVYIMCDQTTNLPAFEGYVRTVYVDN